MSVLTIRTAHSTVGPIVTPARPVRELLVRLNGASRFDEYLFIVPYSLLPHGVQLRRRLRSSGVLVAALSIGGLALAACGGASASSTPSTSSTAAATGGGAPAGGTAQNVSAFTNCLKAHGLTLPAGGSGPGAGAPAGGFAAGGSTPGAGAPSAKNRAAFQACAKYQPKGGFANGGGGFGAGSSNSAATAAFRNCMSLHGVTLTNPKVPTGTPQTSGSTSTSRPGFATNNPKYAAAFSACKALLPTPSTSTNPAG